MSKKKIVLIDGHSILTRAFFGVPDLTNAAGLHTNAVYGFLNIMFKILEEEKPEYLMVAFDVKAPTFRHKMFDGYKGTRKPMPAELHEQVPMIQELLASMNIKVVTLEGYEADDILGTVAKKAEAEEYDVTIVSGDRDLLQLATDKILIRIPKTKQSGTEIENYFASDVFEKYGVSPTEFIDMKGLMGDTADNIPGVKSIGEKTAAKLITEYKTIENIYQNIASVKPERVKNALIADEKNARLSKLLATIQTDSPVEIDFSQCRIQHLFNPEAYKLMKTFGFKTFLAKFDEQTAEQAAEFDPLKKLHSIEDKASLENLIQQLESLSSDCCIGYADYFQDEFSTNCVCLSFQGDVYLIEKKNDLSINDLQKLLPILYEEKKLI